MHLGGTRKDNRGVIDAQSDPAELDFRRLRVVSCPGVDSWQLGGP